MTSKLTIEQAKRLRNDFECWQQDYDPKDDKEQYDMFGRGMAAMDMLIAGMYQGPVAWRVTFTQIGHESNNFTKTYWDEEEKDRWVKLHKMSGFKVNVEPLYTAPPVQAAMDSEPVGEFYEDGPLNWYQISDGDRVPEHRRIPLYRHAQQPVVPATLPCSVELKPGLIIGKGCKTETLLTALRSRADYNADIDAMTPEERAEHDASIKAFKAMLAAAPQPQNAPQNIPEIIPGWIPVSEQLPEECGRYWCYVEEQTDLGKSHYQWNCSWNGERWWVEGEDGGIVTHWMPLPAAPQEVK